MNGSATRKSEIVLHPVARTLVGLTMASLLLMATMHAASAYRLTYYYDPDTGNVSFDTANTRTGGVIVYKLSVFPDQTPIRFRPENHILVTGSPLFLSESHTVQEASFVQVSGLFTIGDVLPVGLTEETWTSLFTSPTGDAVYGPGLGTAPSYPIEYLYGRPDREFDNHWDLVDPDTLGWADDAKLIYRQATGELVYDTSVSIGAYTTGFSLKSDDQFLNENFTPPFESEFFGAHADTLYQISNPIEAGEYSLGTVLQAGLSQSEFEATLTEAYFFGSRGFGGGELDLETDGTAMTLVFLAIPEPASCALMLLACGFLLRRRRLAA